MAVATYTVKRGDTLTKIANGGCGSSIAKSISGSTVAAKINTLVKLNHIANRNLIYVGQVLKLSSTKSSSSSKTTSSTSSRPVIKALALEAGDTTGRSMYTTWAFSKSGIKEYKVQWAQYKDNKWQSEELQTISHTAASYLYSTFSANAASTAVRVRVQAVSGSSSWKSVWSSEKIYYFKNNPPLPCPTPTLEIDNNTLKGTASISFASGEEREKTYAKEIQFQIIKNNSINLGTVTSKINTTGNYVRATFNVAAGGEYKVRARSKNGRKYSSWSNYSSSVGTKPSSPKTITECRANSYNDGTVSVYLEWPEVTNADSYDIEYATNKNYFDGTDQTTTLSGIEFTHYEIMSLELGKEYFFRVRASNQNGKSDWSEIKSTPLGTKPIAPTTWSSTTKAIVGEPLNLYWVHNSEDGSSQKFAELRLYINNVLQEPDITIRNSEDPDKKDKTSVYSIDTNEYPEGTQIKWQIRTCGITNEYSDWSIERIVDIFAQPTLNLAVTDLPDGTGEIIDTLTSFPFYIYALPGPDSQSPIGYHVKVIANEYYETINNDGTAKTVNKGDAVYSKYFDINTALMIEMSADNIDLEPNIEYSIVCSVIMNSGLKAEDTHNFNVDWNEYTYNVDADVTIDYETLTATIVPYSTSVMNDKGSVNNYADLPTDPLLYDTYTIINAGDYNEAGDIVMWSGYNWDNFGNNIDIQENGSLISDLTLSVYRREFDGTFTELGTNIPNDNSVSIMDPHPSLDYARYRITAKSKTTGAISFYDMAGVKVGGNSVVIQWDQDWSIFGDSEEYDVERPSWSGSRLVIPYNIDVSNSYSVETELVQYAGRKHPVSYYGTQLGETANWNVEIPVDDKDTLYDIRRLAIWTGDVYVREPSGTGYWANIVVSYNQTHNEVTIPVSFSITRVEGGI